MKKLHNVGKVAAAIATSAAMLLSMFAVTSANAADGGACGVSDQQSFETALADSGCSTIKLTGDKDGIFKFGLESTAIQLAPLGSKTDVTGYGKVATEKVTRPVTITSDSKVVMRNVQFDVESGGDLTFDGQVILDDAELAGVALPYLLGLGSSANVAGIEYGVKVNGGKFTMNGSSVIAVGAATSTTEANRGIVVSANGSEVNLNSSATYDRANQAGLAIVQLKTIVPGLGNLLDALLNPILGILSFNRTVVYPTVWGRDAAVYSDPSVTNASINITAGSYLNQKDEHPLGKVVLNAAVSSSATVNIIGSSAVKISNTKIGNAINSSYEGVNTTGTLNLANPNAVLDPAVENDSKAQQASTDSYALELRGSATANIVAGSVSDTLHTSSPKVLETEADSRVNILSANSGDVKIAGQQYWIQQAQKNGPAFSAQVNSSAAVTGETTDNYELWSSGAAAKSDSVLSQLAELTAKEAAGSDPAAAKLSQSAYATGRLSAAYLEDVSADGRAVYGRHVISTSSETPFTNKGTVVLYGLPWVGKYTTDNTAPEQASKLFAGWYTSQDAFEKEDALQASTDPAKHHTWNPSDETFDGTFGNTVVVSTDKYTGSLYPHFVGEDTIKVTGVQIAKGSKAGRYNLRFVSGLDSYNFKSANFKISYNGKLLGTIRSTKVFDYIDVYGTSHSFENNPSAAAAGYDTSLLGQQGEARYITTALLSNVKVGAQLEVTPSWTTLDGVTVTGSAFGMQLNEDGTVTRL